MPTEWLVVKNKTKLAPAHYYMNTLLLRLREKWGFVCLQPVGCMWRCANTTDEGLGAECEQEYYGDTPFDAVYKAYRTIRRLYEKDRQTDIKRDVRGLQTEM